MKGGYYNSHDARRIAATNAQRWATLFRAPYDPATGTGCTGERFSLATTDDVVLQLPASMLEDDQARPLVERIQEAGTLERVATRFALEPSEHAAFVRLFLDARYRHDPEFWFASAVKIKTKRIGVQPFVLRPPQRLLLAELMGQFTKGEPVRVLLVKARQWGGSTLVQLLIAWIQQYVERGWNAMIVGDVQQQAAHIRDMYTTLAKHYPEALGTITLRPYEGMQNIRYLAERDCILGVGSAERPNSLRSFTTQMLHLSEVGLWKSTPERSAEDLAQALEGGLVDGAHTLCVLESTAKGQGNYFHRQYEAAKKGESTYRNVFVGWWQIEDYTEPVATADVHAFVESWTSYERWLWELGATIEGIAWYRRKQHSMPASEREMRMKEEYPSTAEEAFQASGRPVFAPEYVSRARLATRAPLQRGQLLADGHKGEKALTGIRWLDDPQGPLQVWRLPGDTLGGLLDLEGKHVTDRYCAFMDIGARWHGGDWHVVTVIDRAKLLLGDAPEVVAEWRTHLDQDLAAWAAVQLCTWYERAFLAVEKNSLRKKQGDGSFGPDDSYLTVLDEIRDVYEDRLFYTVEVDNRTQEQVRKLGFSTNRSTKPMIIDALNAAIRDGGYVERSGAACDEMSYYELKADGTMGAREGQHDDRVMSRAGSVWLSASYLPVPQLVEVTSFKPRSRPGGAASF